MGRDNKKYRSIMVHRAIYGSLERFIGILIEHYAGSFSIWLSPLVQVVKGYQEPKTINIEE